MSRIHNVAVTCAINRLDLLLLGLVVISRVESTQQFERIFSQNSGCKQNGWYLSLLLLSRWAAISQIAVHRFCTPFHSRRSLSLLHPPCLA